MKETAIFEFVGWDSIAQFGVGMMALGFGALLIPIYVYKWGGATAAVAAAIAIAMLLVGLRISIRVTSSKVTITRKWFGIPYKRYTAPNIDDVWYGGDWGEEHGASGVVVKLGRQEVHIGSRRTMRMLHKALLPLTTQWRPRKAQQAVQPEVPASGWSSG